MVDGSPKGSLGKDQTGSGKMAREWPIRLRLERKLLGEPLGGGAGEECVSPKGLPGYTQGQKWTETRLFSQKQCRPVLVAHQLTEETTESGER